MLAAFFMDNMNGKDLFAEANPFLNLSKKGFPRRTTRGAASVELAPQQEQVSENAQDEESRLFLQSVRVLPLNKTPSCKTLSSVVSIRKGFATPRLLVAKTEDAAYQYAAPACQNLQKPVERHIPTSRQTRAYDAKLRMADDEEQARDFVGAMRDVRPLKNKGGRDLPRDPEPPIVSAPPQRTFQELLENTLEFALSFSEEYIEGHVVGLESLIMQKLRVGQYRPEAHLDLHGLNARQAFDALVAFIRRSWHRGMRTLLLIPGRGKNSPDGMAILRERVQSWLTQDPLKRVVLAFCTAKAVDGGPGSLYVLLRKYRKRGKIFWERCPIDLDL